MTDDQFRKSLQDAVNFYRSVQADYGKWLVNTLWLLHSGSIVGLLFKATGNAAPPYFNALWWFVAGIFLAFCAGLAAWFNFTFVVQANLEMANRMLAGQQLPKEFPRLGSIETTIWIALIAGSLSLLCLIGGAIAVWWTWPR